ncbi:DUF6876 family protein [Dyadobacter endophyticus]|uniref:DUF6876 family protein n=1 Tax=Dyadobacter endophyticus TaxID=1749036 RepID=UPI003CEA52C9
MLPCWCCLSRLSFMRIGIVLQRWRHSDGRNMETRQLTSTELSQFTGTETCYRHPVVRKMLYTDGRFCAINYLRNHS